MCTLETRAYITNLTRSQTSPKYGKGCHFYGPGGDSNTSPHILRKKKLKKAITMIKLSGFLGYFFDTTKPLGHIANE